MVQHPVPETVTVSFFFNSTLTISKSFFLNRCPDHQAIHTALRLIIVRTFQGKKSVTVVKQI